MRFLDRVSRINLHHEYINTIKNWTECSIQTWASSSISFCLFPSVSIRFWVVFASQTPMQCEINKHEPLPAYFWAHHAPFKSSVPKRHRWTAKGLVSVIPQHLSAPFWAHPAPLKSSSVLQWHRWTAKGLVFVIPQHRAASFWARPAPCSTWWSPSPL